MSAPTSSHPRPATGARPSQPDRLGRFDVGTDRGVLIALAHIDDAGWDGPVGTAVLTYARMRVVRPQVRRAGLVGPAADQAEATGWALAWELLSSRALRRTGSPWGVVSAAVRRAVLGEVVSAAYGTGVRQGWRLAASRTEGAAGSPAPLRTHRLVPLPEGPGEPVAGADERPGPVIELAAGALVGAGWPRHEALTVVEWAAAHPRHRSATGARGWRTLAAQLGIPPWRARRATILLLGTATWPGLLEQVARDGASALHRADLRAALRSTVVASRPSPAGVSRRALVRAATSGHRRAS
jgi:hypothetical protein